MMSLSPLHEIRQGHVLDRLREMEDNSVNCVVTSPPYYGLRDYGNPDQLGLESSPYEYVENMVNVFRDVRRVLREDGTLWLNLGDSYAGGGRGGNPPDSPYQKQATNRGSLVPRTPIADGLKPSDLIGIPWRVALALQNDGWYLRSDIVWHKPNAMPESVRSRPTKAHEYIFLLSKTRKYYYDHEAIKEDAVKGAAGSRFDTGKTGQHQLGRSSSAERVEDGKRNKRSVWTVSTKPFKGAHFAVFPPDLIEPCVLAGCPPDGVVLDPFAGSGTTMLVATKHNRKSIGIEINHEYVALAEARLAGRAVNNVA